MASFNVDDGLAVLSRTPKTLNAMLKGMPDSWVRSTEGDSTWNAYDIIGHLISGERTDWMPRIRIMLDNDAARQFHPVDRFAQFKESQDKSLEQLLDEFAALRGENLSVLRAMKLGPQDLNRQRTHPALGPVTLSQLLATWTVHDLTHLHQLSRVMAHQYRTAVGPWSAYLGVLQCSGHSIP